MKYLIKNGHVVDPANKIDEIRDILISGNRIEKSAKSISEKADRTIDAKGLIVAPGFIDMHVHLREPGREDKETVKTGTRAAVRGGFTSVACMPNTEPSIDRPEGVRKIKEIAARDAACNVFVVAAITQERAGKGLTDFGGLKEAGAVGLSDDGCPVDDPSLFEKAVVEAHKCGLTLIEHCEDRKLSAGGVINAGFIATKMGLRGISRESEYGRIGRDIDIAKKTGRRLHVAHVSCAESVELIRKAKSSGVMVTAETAPHYFTLTEECCVTYDTNTKMNPPLRAKEDVAAIRTALADGVIDAIATDHAPHTDAEKDVEFDFAPFGVIGLETALSLAYMELIEQKKLSWSDLVTRLSSEPARILNVPGGSLKTGGPADITIIDPAIEYVYKKESIASKSKNSPFIDWKLKARVTHVFVGGKHVLGNGDQKTGNRG